jgi:hypothetical protein
MTVEDWQARQHNAGSSEVQCPCDMCGAVPENDNKVHDMGLLYACDNCIEYAHFRAGIPTTNQPKG